MSDWAWVRKTVRGADALYIRPDGSTQVPNALITRVVTEGDSRYWLDGRIKRLLREEQADIPAAIAPVPIAEPMAPAAPPAEPMMVVTLKAPPPAPIVTASGETLIPVSNSAPRVEPVAPVPVVPTQVAPTPVATVEPVVVTFRPPPPPVIVTSSGETLVPVSNSAPRVQPTIIPDLIATRAPAAVAMPVAAPAAEPELPPRMRVAPPQEVEVAAPVPPPRVARSRAAEADPRALAALQQEVMQARTDAANARRDVQTALNSAQKALSLIDQLDQIAGNRLAALEKPVADAGKQIDELQQAFMALKKTTEGLAQRAILKKTPLFGPKKAVNSYADGEIIDG